jgi:hypothetical protein
MGEPRGLVVGLVQPQLRSGQTVTSPTPRALTKACDYLFGDNLPGGGEVHVERLAALLDEERTEGTAELRAHLHKAAHQPNCCDPGCGLFECGTCGALRGYCQGAADDRDEDCDECANAFHHAADVTRVRAEGVREGLEMAAEIAHSYVADECSPRFIANRITDRIRKLADEAGR